MAAPATSSKHTSRAPPTTAQKSKNAQAVARFRDRRKIQLEQLTAENASLKEQNDELQSENSKLRERAPGSTAPTHLAQVEVDNYLLRRENEHLRSLLEECLLGQHGDVPRYDLATLFLAARGNGTAAQIEDPAAHHNQHTAPRRVSPDSQLPVHSLAGTGVGPRHVPSAQGGGNMGIGGFLPELASSAFGLEYSNAGSTSMRSSSTHDTPGRGSSVLATPPSLAPPATPNPVPTNTKLDPGLSFDLDHLDHIDLHDPSETDLLRHIALPAAIPPALVGAQWSPESQAQAQAGGHQAHTEQLVGANWSMFMGAHAQAQARAPTPPSSAPTPTSSHLTNRAGTGVDILWSPQSHNQPQIIPHSLTPPHAHALGVGVQVGAGHGAGGGAGLGAHAQYA